MPELINVRYLPKEEKQKLIDNILSLRATGLTGRAIGERLGVGTSFVEYHLRMQKKLTSSKAAFTITDAGGVSLEPSNRTYIKPQKTSLPDLAKYKLVIGSKEQILEILRSL